jgi:hypothetical protein
MNPPFIIEKLRNIKIYQIYLKIPQNDTQHLEFQIGAQFISLRFNNSKWKNMQLVVDEILDPQNVSIKIKSEHVEMKIKFISSSQELTNESKSLNLHSH